MVDIERVRQPGEMTGFNCSDVKEYVVNGLGSIASPIDFDRPYAMFAISCNDASGIPSRTLKLRVARWSDGTLNPLWALNGSAEWQSGTLPTSGGFDFLVTNAAYATKLQPEFDGTVTGTTTLYISAYGPGID